MLHYMRLVMIQELRSELATQSAAIRHFRRFTLVQKHLTRVAAVELNSTHDRMLAAQREITEDLATIERWSV